MFLARCLLAKPPSLADNRAVQADFNTEAWLRWEADCLQRARSGQSAAISELYRAFAGPLFSQCLLPRLGNRAAAEDALADTFQALLEHLASYEPQGKSIWFWLSRIAMNKALDQHRRSARSGRGLVNYEQLLAIASPPSITPRDTLEQKEAEQQLKWRVDAVLQALHGRYRRAIELRLFEERSREDCAEQLAVSVATFDVVLLRAVRAFRTAWESDDKLSKVAP